MELLVTAVNNKNVQENKVTISFTNNRVKDYLTITSVAQNGKTEEITVQHFSAKFTVSCPYKIDSPYTLNGLLCKSLELTLFKHINMDNFSVNPESRYTVSLDWLNHSWENVNITFKDCFLQQYLPSMLTMVLPVSEYAVTGNSAGLKDFHLKLSEITTPSNTLVDLSEEYLSRTVTAPNTKCSMSAHTDKDFFEEDGLPEKVECTTASTGGNDVYIKLDSVESGSVFIPHNRTTNYQPFHTEETINKLKDQYEMNGGKKPIEPFQFFLTPKQKKMCDSFVEYFGKEKQFLKIAEEAAELSAAVIKSSLYPDSEEYKNDVYKEIADLMITLYQNSTVCPDSWAKLFDTTFPLKVLKADFYLQKVKAEANYERLQAAPIRDLEKINAAEFEVRRLKAVLKSF